MADKLVVGGRVVARADGLGSGIIEAMSYFMRRWLLTIWILFVCVGFLVWWEWPSAGPQLYICDVGQGDGMVTTQGFSQMVVDTGRNNGAMNECLGEVLPFWDRHLEMVVITHADSDHAGGLGRMLESYTIGRLVTAEKAREEIAVIVSDVMEVEMVSKGHEWSWGAVRVKVMWPPPLSGLPAAIAKSANDAGLVLRLDFNNGSSAWLAADAGEKVEKILVGENVVQPATLLKVSHHGSRFATTKPFLAILQPRLSVVSVGKNRYGHPSGEVLERLGEIGSEIRRTDMEGLIHWQP